MSSRKAESKIQAAIVELESRGDYTSATWLQLGLDSAKGYLPDLKNVLALAKECLTGQSNKS